MVPVGRFWDVLRVLLEAIPIFFGHTWTFPVMRHIPFDGGACRPLRQPVLEFIERCSEAGQGRFLHLQLGFHVRNSLSLQAHGLGNVVGLCLHSVHLLTPLGRIHLFRDLNKTLFAIAFSMGPGSQGLAQAGCAFLFVLAKLGHVPHPGRKGLLF